MTDALTLRDLSKTYRNGFQALKGIDLTVPEGEFYALLGPNGAGKSTTIGIISSLTRKTSGTVEIFGHDLDTHPSHAKQCLGVVPQEFNFGQFEKIFDILVTQAGYYGIPPKIAQTRAEEYLEKLGLWEKRNTQGRMLSGGVDIELRRSMWDFLTEMNEKGTSIILTTHYLEEAEMLCRQIAIIDRGVIKEDTSMKAFLNQLSEESFIFDLEYPIEPVTVDIIGVKFNLIDPMTLEVTMDKAHALNDLFQLLEAQGIRVRSMRNKSNRLEELFVKMVEKNLQGAAQ
ncbi:MAG: putative ABC transporter ATP-binding protein YadG [Acinetobacter bereziniae]|uniref:Putative ABC transporter ATP-binding protein YadG n=1 Tax=Acinetobacter bereziniae TaxID=106648 RepID=A0A833PD38_ACIBZ|nr:MAG: putative ABC transporter ATP-binding protein YadG [Acinetobacter bereziniae]